MIIYIEDIYFWNYIVIIGLILHAILCFLVFFIHNSLFRIEFGGRLIEQGDSLLFWFTLLLNIAVVYSSYFIFRRIYDLFVNNTINNLRFQKIEFDVNVSKYKSRLEEIIKYARYLHKFKKIMGQKNYVPANYLEKKLHEKAIEITNKNKKLTLKENDRISKENTNDIFNQLIKQNNDEDNLDDLYLKKIILASNNLNLLQKSSINQINDIISQAEKEIGQDLAHKVIEEINMNFLEEEKDIDDLNKSLSHKESFTEKINKIRLMSENQKSNSNDIKLKNKKEIITSMKSNSNIENENEIRSVIANTSNKLGLGKINVHRSCSRPVKIKNNLSIDGDLYSKNVCNLKTNKLNDNSYKPDNEKRNVDNRLKNNHLLKNNHKVSKSHNKIGVKEKKEDKIINNIKRVVIDDDSSDQYSEIFNKKKKEDNEKKVENETDLFNNIDENIVSKIIENEIFDDSGKTFNSKNNIFEKSNKIPINEKYMNNETIIEESLLDKTDMKKTGFFINTSNYFGNDNKNVIYNDIPADLVNDIEIDESNINY